VYFWATLPLLMKKTPIWNRCCSMTSSKKVRFYPFFLADIIYQAIIAVHKAQPGWRRVIAQAVLWGIPTPAFSTALAFFDGYRSEVLPANLIQAQVRLQFLIFATSLKVILSVTTSVPTHSVFFLERRIQNSRVGKIFVRT
jgi:6-phosphogluconate dehydrogenase, C-terminal domain